MTTVSLPVLLALTTIVGCQPTIGSDAHGRVVAGTSDDFMVVRYLKLEGTDEEIGAALAKVARDNHSVKLDKADAKELKGQLDWFKKNWPEHYARTEGVAKTYGAKGQDTTALGYDMDVEPGCSTVFYPGSSVTNGHSMLSRNYDFPTAKYAELTGRKAPAGARAMTADPYVFEVHPKKGYASLFVCAYDLLGGCVDGINEKGLAVALLADDMAEERIPTRGPGLSEVTVPRFLLDRCATAKEARKLLDGIEYHYSFTPCHYIVCDASGDSFVWELSPDLSKRYVVDGGGKPQIVTNHRLSKYGAKDLPQGNSFDRYKRLQSEISGKGGKLSPEDVRTTNLCVAVPATVAQAATLWHSVYDLTARTLKVSFFLGNEGGKERRSPYLEFKLK